MGSLQATNSTGVTPGGVSEGWPAFSASLQALDLVRLDRNERRFTHRIADSAFGDLRIRRAGSDGGALRCIRSASRIAAYQEDMIWVCLVTGGSLEVRQNAPPVVLARGDMVLVDACQPYELSLPSSELDTLWIGTTRAVAEAHIWDLDGLLGCRIDGASGSGRMASQVLQAAFAPLDAQAFEASGRIARSLLDILGAATADYRIETARSPYRAATMRRVKGFIEDHLEDETLSVGVVAAHLGVSTRYLAKVFEGEPDTVAGWIWARRLERCRAALVASQGDHTISTIAYAHGFKNVSHFSRAFRKRYGQSPRAALRTGGDGSDQIGSTILRG